MSPAGSLPMFPLGTALFPHCWLPLHVFEPRYRELTRDCLAGDREFGVVLIERGSEVGGGDQRFAVGTVARILEALPSPDGRWALGTVGTRRIRVRRWLPDAPYPRAEVEDLPEAPFDEADRGALDDLERLVRRGLALRYELDEPAAPMGVELADDPLTAGWQLAALAQLGPADQQRVLEADDPGDRLRLLTGLVADDVEVLARRLSAG